MAHTRMLSAEALQDKLRHGERVQIVDVRSVGEFAAGHLPGAVNLPLEQLDARLDDLSARDPLVLVCQSGKRACMAHARLQHEREDMFILEGGTASWASRQWPLVSGLNATWSLERQVRFAAGILVAIGSGLAVWLNPGWALLSLFVGLGLTFAGLTNICGMAALFAKMPWNHPKSVSKPTMPLGENQ